MPWNFARWVFLPEGRKGTKLLRSMLGSYPSPPFLDISSYHSSSLWLCLEFLSEEQATKIIKLFSSTGDLAIQITSQSGAEFCSVLMSDSMERWSQRLELLFHEESTFEIANEIKLFLAQSQKKVQAWKCGKIELSFLRDKPFIMGIVNVTPDSFSDGGLFFEREQAVKQALDLVEQGADIIDIGGESTRPGSKAVSVDEECARVLPVIEALSTKSSVLVSIDTYKAEVADRAIQAGADIVNDISCLRFDPKLASVVAKHHVPLILMHSRHSPSDMQKAPFYRNFWPELLKELQAGLQVALDAGIRRDMIALDPGIGFGKRQEDNLRILREFKVMRSFGLPLLIGASRKSFLGKILDKEADQRIFGSLAAAAAAFWGGADILRVHDVSETRELLCVLQEIGGRV